MLNKVIANAQANLIFYRRNKLLWLIGLFFLIYCGLSMIPAFFYTTSQNKFDVLLMALRSIFFFVKVFVLAMGVLTVWYQLRNRCYKMVVTRPCPPELWIVGTYASALFVILILYLAIFGCCLLFFVAFKVPVQWGILYLMGDEFGSLLAQFSLLNLLCVLMHPFMGFLIYLTFNDWVFYQLTILTSAGYQGAESAWGKALYGMGKALFSILYFAVPSWDLNGKRTDAVWQSLRLEPEDLSRVALMVLYGLLVAALCFSLTSFVLRRRRAI